MRERARLDSTTFLFLLQDGIINGAIYALLAMALMLVFAVTRVILVPQGEFVTYGALKLAMLSAACPARWGCSSCSPASHWWWKPGASAGASRRASRFTCALLCPAAASDRRELFGSMSVADNRLLGGFRRPSSERAEALEQVYTRFPRLQERRALLAGTLSGGERQMLAMGRALMGRPRLLVLDEPSLGLAPLIVRDIFEIIVGLKETGVSMLLVEQNARSALQVADHAYVMELGEITAEGPASRLAADPRIVESYLGLGGAE
jgi:ABC-type branched-subunit amino acid transport system ATPase component